MKAFSSQSCFVARNGAIQVTFDVKNPFVVDDVELWLAKNQVPSSISHKGIEFDYHGLVPLWNFESLRDIIRSSW